MFRLIKTPKTQMGFLLFAIFITAIVVHYRSPKLVELFLLSLIFTVFFDLLFLKIRKIKLFFPSAGLVTGSIIGLIASPNLVWHQLLFVCAFAMFSKNFIRLNKKHIFNPAAFGVFFSHLLFGQIISWWGSAWFGLNSLVVILLLPAFVSAYKMRRWKNIVVFLLVYYLLNIKNGLVFDPTVLFFAIVMLPEPMTTPATSLSQILFGSFVALVSRFLNFSWLPDVFAPALLLGNLLFFNYKWGEVKK